MVYWLVFRGDDMRMICNKAGLTYWADTDNNDAVMSPYFEDEEDAIQWYGRVAQIMFEEFDVNNQGIVDAIVRVRNSVGVEK